MTDGHSYISLVTPVTAVTGIGGDLQSPRIEPLLGSGGYPSKCFCEWSEVTIASFYRAC